MNERIDSVARVRQWKDEIPFHYEYTAGVAGERFLRGLMEGRIIGARCDGCGKTWLPPRMYCVECYSEIKRYVRVSPHGRVSALTRTSTGQDGEALEAPATFAYITFEGIDGGILHRALGRARVGSRVRPRFRKRGERVGSILDIDGFEPE